MLNTLSGRLTNILRTLALVCVAQLTVSACVDVSVPEVVPPSESELLARVKAAQKGFIAVQGDTFRIAIRATNLRGEEISIGDGDSLRFISSNTDMVTVDSSGLITAIKPTDGQLVTVIISLSKRSVKRLDTANVVVLPERVTISSIKISPVDSTRIGVLSGIMSVKVSAHDPAGKKIPNVFVPIIFERDFAMGNGIIIATTKLYSPNDTAYIRSLLNFGYIGDLWLIANVNAFGTVFRDSVKYTGIYPSSQMVNIEKHEVLNTIGSPQANQNFRIQPCGMLMFMNTTNEPLDVVFDNPSATTECTPGDEIGNIIAIEPDGMGGRKFRNVGTTTWTVRNSAGVATAVSGKVTVKDDQ